MKKKMLARSLVALTLIISVGCKKEKPKVAEERIPVAVAVAEQKNVPLQIETIGNVQPTSTVAVRALVSGELTRVAFKEGDDVRQGSALFTIDPRPYQAQLAQAEANLARDEAQLRNAEADAVRYVDLVKKDYVTKEDYDKITAAAAAAKAVVAADHAAIQTARLQLSYCEIRSPIEGRTGSLMVHAGNLVKANDTTPLVVINRVHPIYVQFTAPESQLAELRARYARSAGVPVTATPQGSNHVAQGRLTFVDNAVDASTGTITLKATFSNEDRVLWPGQFVNVAVTIADRPNAVVVPAQAVQTGQKGQFVYVVSKDNSVQMRPVNVGDQVDQIAIIAKGVAPGETVVTDGQLRLTPKSKVEIKGAL